MLDHFPRVSMRPQCKSAFAGQTSGYCLSKLEAPPTTSATTSDFTVDFWYPGKRYWRRLLSHLSYPSRLFSLILSPFHRLRDSLDIGRMSQHPPPALQ